MHLEKIKTPADLRALDSQELGALCQEMRDFIVQAV
jgi:deoxyxylulose-5-phosphate synthase